jgi:two-component system response regulator AtoC
MRAVKSVVEAMADIDATVLLRGESGVGKDLVARAVHAASARHARPFVKVNCAALPHDLLESELFGHEKGAFTGAVRRKLGQFECAHTGTIYLDEIGELPLSLQAKLLHVLQDFTFVRVGGQEAITVDARIIAATNRDLEAALGRGEFREDLYYRLNVVEIRVPPLRARRDEIPELVALLLARFNAQYHREQQVSPRLLARLMEHDWPGNVRELENVIRRIVVLGISDETIEALLRATPADGPRGQERMTSALTEGLRDLARRGAKEAERKALAEVLAKTGWNRAEAARILRVSYKTLLNKISECGLTAPRRT